MRVLLLYTVLILTAACNNPTNVPNSETKKIFGSWKQINPEEAVIITLSEKGTYVEERNGKIVIKSKFRFEDLCPTFTYPIDFNDSILGCGKRWLHGYDSNLDMLKLESLSSCGTEYSFARIK